jgi:hypothetical protein
MELCNLFNLCPTQAQSNIFNIVSFLIPLLALSASTGIVTGIQQQIMSEHTSSLLHIAKLGHPLKLLWLISA